MNTTIDPRDAVRVLREARRRIASGEGRYICIAIGYQFNEPREVRARLHERIRSVLRPHSSFSGWFYAHHGRVPSCTELRDLRIAWLDRWIAAIEQEYGV